MSEQFQNVEQYINETYGAILNTINNDKVKKNDDKPKKRNKKKNKNNINNTDIYETTREIYIKYYAQLQENGLELYNIPIEYHNIEMYRIAIRQNYISFGAIPKENQCDAICEYGIAINALVWQFFNNEQKKKFKEDAIRRNGIIIFYMNDDELDEYLDEMAAISNPASLLWMSIKRQTARVCFSGCYKKPAFTEYIKDPKMKRFIINKLK